MKIMPACASHADRLRIVIIYVQYGRIHAVLFFGRLISRSHRPLLPPLPHGSVVIICLFTQADCLRCHLNQFVPVDI